MRKHSIFVAKDPEKEFRYGSRNWLLHARYVRGEHAMCLDLADELQRRADNTHRYAHFVKGLVYADAGRHQEALERFHSCLRLKPQDPEPLKQVAKSLYCQGRYQLSLEAYLEADKLSKHPDSDIYCALAECAWHLGQLERGAEWARAGVQAGGGERAGALLARLLHAAGDAAGAAAAYDQAIATHACGADTLAAAGALRLRAGAPREAFQLLGAALAQQPTQHAAALALAAMMLQHRDLDAALARLKAALSAHPTCVAAHTNLGLALLAKKKYVAALTCLQRAVWSAPLSARAAHNLGLALLLCRRPASAFCRLATAAALQPHQPYTVLLIGIALERLGDARADAAYARAAALAPDDALVRLNRAGRLARSGLADQAVAETRLVAELLQREEKPDAQLSSSLATLLAALRDAGVRLADLPRDLPRAESPEEAPENDMTPDEVSAVLDAEMIVLPPLVLNYDELAFDAQATNAAEPTPEQKPQERQLLDKLNKYTLKFEGNFAIPDALKADLLKNQFQDETRRSALANGLGNLLLQKANIIPTPSINANQIENRETDNGSCPNCRHNHAQGNITPEHDYISFQSGLAR